MVKAFKCPLTKTKTKQLGLLLFTIMGIFILGLSMTSEYQTINLKILESLKEEKSHNQYTPIIFGYVTSWSKEIPDPFSITHLSYAFAVINDDYNTISIKNADRFKDITHLKSKNPELKVLLSIGGWGAGNFSEMAASDSLRTAFIGNTMTIIRSYNIDGLDIDWEYPGSSLAKISSSKNDRTNFTILMAQLRDSLGPDRILTFASPQHGNYYEYSKLIDIVDFINIMAYDMGTPPFPHAPLFRSDHTRKNSVADLIANHYVRGVPPSKMVVGIPFYGRGNEKDYKKYEDYRYISEKKGTLRRFDTISYSSYIANKETGELLISFDDTTSVKVKCKLIKDLGLRGVMFWHYCGDTSDHQLLTAIQESFKQFKSHLK